MRTTLLPFLLVFFVLGRYYPALNAFWMFDDTQLLKFAVTYRPWEYFFVPSVWRELTVSNFTPWVVFSLDIDWRLFGLNPFGFYLHHLVSLSVLAAVTFLVLRLWLSPALSFSGVLLFTASPPFAESAYSLMERHYIEGFILSLLAVYCSVISMRKGKSLLGIAGALFYLLACSAKEVYVPLIGLLFLLPEAGGRRQLRHILPWFGSALVYVLWRWFMLGHLFGGYGIQLAWQDIVHLFPRMVDAMGIGLNNGPRWWRWLIGCSVASSLIVLLKNDRKILLCTLMAALFVVLPIVPVSSIMSPRYVWLFSFLFVVLHLLSWHALGKGKTVLIGIFVWGVILLSGFLTASFASPNFTKDVLDRYRIEGTFVLREGKTSDLLVGPVGAGWYYSGLSWLRKRVLHLDEGPSVTADSDCICSETAADGKNILIANRYMKVWFFQGGRNTLTSEGIREFCKESLSNAKIREDVPLAFSIDYRDPVFSWEFGPYAQGDYAFLLGETGETIFPLPTKGRRLISFQDEHLFLRLRYISPEGWKAYSSPVRLDIAKGQGRVSWSR